MTPEQIEAAARELCRIRGLDPDAREPYDGHNSATYGKARWELVSQEVSIIR